MLGLSGCAGNGGSGNGSYPQEDLTIIVPYGEGGGTDTYARQVASPLSDQLGVNVVVENMTGAGGARGTGEAITNGDEYTLLANNLAIMPSAILQTRPPWAGQLPDIVPVYGYGYNANVLIGQPDKAQNFEEFIEMIQTDSINTVSTVGPGSGGDMVMSALVTFDEYPIEDSDFETVPYDSGAEVGRAVTSGEVDVGITAATPLAAAYDGSNFTPLVSFSSQGSPVFPDIPTVVDLGYNNMDTIGQNTRCLWMSPGTSQEKAQTISTAVSEAIKAESVQSWAEETGNPTTNIKPDELEGLLVDSMKILPTILGVESIDGWPQPDRN
ncbi:tripartite tricarboxylate transporter substrate-binding protein [Haloferax sp. AB510]|uniref:tripartite tricarboxylate transporter substrate-binding protein n=1 Tax=Haloferax sp. AB510 TaxID=2934172 RepID=UPI00209C16AA|nr:tripartite tricarboxylate transporter substrate-binding protein [Haloferax sp. AB510]MCO8268420.1 tripartite tricarboxylate transporter substrate-binding protein [Haloferax sp. AB510]